MEHERYRSTIDKLKTDLKISVFLLLLNLYQCNTMLVNRKKNMGKLRSGVQRINFD